MIGALAARNNLRVKMVYSICCREIMNMQNFRTHYLSPVFTPLITGTKQCFLNVKRTCPTPYSWPFSFSLLIYFIPAKKQSVVKLNFRFCKLFSERSRRGVWSASSCDRLAFLTLLGQVKSRQQFLCTVSPNTTSTVSPRSLLASLKPSTPLCVSSTPLSRTYPLQIAQHITSISFRLQRTPTRASQDLYFISW